MKLKDKIAIVTGAGSGIGRGIAELFAQEGAEVVTVGRTREKLDVAKQEAEDGGERLHPRALDVSDRLSAKSLVTATVAQFGRVDILVNNAGVNVAKRALAELSIEDFDKLVQVNLNGAFYMMHGVLPVMREQGGGLIINVSSVAGVRASVLGGAAYSASKFGLSGLSKTIGVEEREKWNPVVPHLSGRSEYADSGCPSGGAGCGPARQDAAAGRSRTGGAVGGDAPSARDDPRADDRADDPEV